MRTLHSTLFSGFVACASAVAVIMLPASAQSVPFTTAPVMGPANAPHPLPPVPRHGGVVAWKTSWHFGLTPGPFFVDLHPYTVIIPTGTTIQKGMHVIVYGAMQYETTPGHPTINASAVICTPPY